ncbi:unnamed protein product [Effrenium voratum]|nr:unnamed protein product [Effrenium voratum]
MAVVCGDHDRTMYLASFIASYSSQLEVCGSASKGSFLRLTQPCTKGSVLLSVPMSSCLCSWDVSDKALEALHPEPMAPLRLALLTAGYSRTEYFSRAAPLEVFSCHMASWPDASVAAEWAGPSLAWRRVGGWRQELRREWQRLRQAGIEVTEEQHLWAALVVQTRALGGSGENLTLCPGIDLCNHVSVGQTARVKIQEHAVELVAEYSMEAGQEVTINYGPDADFLDLFEAFGFFDSTSVIHTVEVEIPLSTMLSDQEWRRDIIMAAAEQGYDEVFEAWWVPDFAVTGCPLWVAARAMFVDQKELPQGSLEEQRLALKRPIRREIDVRAWLAQILRQQLERYPDLGKGQSEPGSPEENRLWLLIWWI